MVTLLEVEIARYRSAQSLCPFEELGRVIDSELVAFLDTRPEPNAIEKKLDELSTRLEATFH